MPRCITRRLTLWVDKDAVGDTADELLRRYQEAAERHNNNVRGGSFPDAGFDLLVPDNEGCVEDAGYVINGQRTQMKLKTGVRCLMEGFEWGNDPEGDDEVSWAESFYLFPRSSISKTQCRLANNVGIIDSGYRGQLIAVFDVLAKAENAGGEHRGQVRDDAQPYSRLVQVCCGDLRPFVVTVKTISGEETERLLSSTIRGDGGFGSTGV